MFHYNILNYILQWNYSQVQPANKVVEIMLKHIIRHDIGYQYFDLKPGIYVRVYMCNSISDHHVIKFK